MGIPPYDDGGYAHSADATRAALGSLEARRTVPWANRWVPGQTVGAWANRWVPGLGKPLGLQPDIDQESVTAPLPFITTAAVRVVFHL